MPAKWRLDDNRGLIKLMQAMTEILTELPIPAVLTYAATDTAADMACGTARPVPDEAAVEVLPETHAGAAPETDIAAPALSDTCAGEPARVAETGDRAVPEPAPAARPGPKKDRFAAVAPVLEKLFEFYPHLFGQRFLPLKLGVFQELLAAHPEVFKRDALKAALGVHTRSTRYLQSVAAGMKRHDLQGKAVEDVAPEHIFLSIAELFARRQARSTEDLKPKLARQLQVAYQAAGLSRQEYLSRLPLLQEPVATLLDEAMAQVDQQRARDAALIRAFDASGKSIEAFAATLALPASQVRAALAQRNNAW